MIDVVIAARSPAVRRGLRALLEAGSPSAAAALVSESDGIRVVGEDASPSDGRASDRPRPDVLIVADPEWLPENVDAATAVVVVADDQKLRGRLAGRSAAGWAIVPPGVSAELLRAAVTATAQGMIVVPLGGTDNRDEEAVDEDDGIFEEVLTSRELEVLELVASGLTNREIAGRLDISEHTVKFHISTIYGKLGASTRTEAVRRAVRRGLVTL